MFKTFSSVSFSINSRTKKVSIKYLKKSFKELKIPNIIFPSSKQTPFSLATKGEELIVERIASFSRQLE